MANDTNPENDLRQLIVTKIRSEIDRNQAEARRFRWTWLVHVVGALAFCAVFTSFLSALYRVAVIDRAEKAEIISDLKSEIDAQTTESDKLTDLSEQATSENRSLISKVRHLEAQLESAIASAVSKERALSEIRVQVANASALTMTPEVTLQLQSQIGEIARCENAAKPSAKDFGHSILVLWWRTDELDAFALALMEPDHNYDCRYAFGCQIGKPTSRLGVSVASGEWFGRWEVVGDTLRLNETFPRPRAGLAIEIDLGRELPQGGWAAKRTMDGTTETGYAELVRMPSAR